MTDHLCGCGCGQPTKLAPRTDRGRGWVKGEPLKVIDGHTGHFLPHPRRTSISEADYTVEDRGYETPCWICSMKSYVDGGYVRIRIHGKKVLAHRAMWEQEIGPIPPDFELDHLCRVPPCIRPSHLEVVTHGVNMQRAWVARRARPH